MAAVPLRASLLLATQGPARQELSSFLSGFMQWPGKPVRRSAVMTSQDSHDIFAETRCHPLFWICMTTM